MRCTDASGSPGRPAAVPRACVLSCICPPSACRMRLGAAGHGLAASARFQKMTILVVCRSGCSHPHHCSCPLGVGGAQQCVRQLMNHWAMHRAGRKVEGCAGRTWQLGLGQGCGVGWHIWHPLPQGAGWAAARPSGCWSATPGSGGPAGWRSPGCLRCPCPAHAQQRSAQHAAQAGRGCWTEAGCSRLLKAAGRCRVLAQLGAWGLPVAARSGAGWQRSAYSMAQPTPAEAALCGAATGRGLCSGWTTFSLVQLRRPSLTEP